MMSHGYLPPTNMARKGTNLDEQDLEEQIKDCLDDLVSRPVLRRSERVMF